jgi:hypothetical protein
MKTLHGTYNFDPLSTAAPRRLCSLYRQFPPQVLKVHSEKHRSTFRLAIMYDILLEDKAILGHALRVPGA